MAISIRNGKVELLARSLAEKDGCSMTEAILRALEDRQRIDVQKKAPRLARLKRIAENCAALPDLDIRSEDDILGYSGEGLL